MKRLLPIVNIKLDRNQFSVFMNWLDSVCEQPTSSIYFQRNDDGTTRMGSFCLSKNSTTEHVDYMYMSNINTDELEIVWNDEFIPENSKLVIGFNSRDMKSAVKENNKKDQGAIIIYQQLEDGADFHPLNRQTVNYSISIEKGEYGTNCHTRIDAVSRIWLDPCEMESSVKMCLPNATMLNLINSSRKKARVLTISIYRYKDDPDSYGFTMTNNTGNNRSAVFNMDVDSMEQVCAFNINDDRIPGILAFLGVFKNGTTRIHFNERKIHFLNRFCSYGEQQMTFAKIN